MSSKVSQPWDAIIIPQLTESHALRAWLASGTLRLLFPAGLATAPQELSRTSTLSLLRTHAGPSSSAAAVLLAFSLPLTVPVPLRAFLVRDWKFPSSVPDPSSSTSRIMNERETASYRAHTGFIDRRATEKRVAKSR